MPSRSNRLRNRKALSGSLSGSDEDVSGYSEGDSTPSPSPLKQRSSRTPTATAKSPRSRARSKKAATVEPPSRLRRLMSVLLATTLLLVLYQCARLYVRSNLEAASSCEGDVVASGPLAKLGRGNVGEFVKSFWPQQGQQQQEQRAQIQEQAVGGMVLHPSANEDDEQQAAAPALSADNSDVRLEDLDMDTLQAAFDALYGDDGPLGPQRGRREGDDGAYRVVKQGRKEGLNEL